MSLEISLLISSVLSGILLLKLLYRYNKKLHFTGNITFLINPLICSIFLCPTIFSIKHDSIMVNFFTGIIMLLTKDGELQFHKSFTLIYNQNQDVLLTPIYLSFVFVLIGQLIFRKFCVHSNGTSR